ncbi:MAG: Cytochrome c oxidase polypeptide I [Ktedonobacterales bacterium]|jgi:cytochrome c oxidase subunit 1|nr:MAG: Cytochrome c oxidase polypeptide I [Ktedonobacterales bacterium]
MAVGTIATRGRAARKRWSQTPLGSWITTTDHKKIGILYIYTGIIFFFLGGIEAALIRWQLSTPDGKLLRPDVYDQIFTMHGTTMIFLFVMPTMAGFGNYLVPLMIGARDMAFPRLNALGYWLLFFGGIFLYSSFISGSAPNAGWFSYAPLTECTPAALSQGLGSLTFQQQAAAAAQAAAQGGQGCFAPGQNADFWIIGINLLGIASLLGALNFIVTILRLRAPGMTINRMPLFVWMTMVTSFLLVFALPSLTVASALLLFDRHLGTHFYQAGFGGDPLLWQHLFWSFGHPEVYILILPAFGMISEILPVFSGKPIFGYTFVAWSGVAIGFLSFTVWAHHMFAVGLPTVAQAFFASSTTLIAIPTAVKIFNWVATTWHGRLRFHTPMLFATGFIAMFLIGGLNGAALGVVPFDYQITDTYFVVAHIHYVLFGGAAMAIFGGIFYWFPKMSGRRLNESLGKIQFWLMLIGMNIAFFPMHILGLIGMPRRQYTYPPNLGWDGLNLLSSIGVLFLIAAFLVFLFNFVNTIRKPADQPADPWDAFTLEWATSSPPPTENFETIPVVRSRRPLWDQKHPDKADWRTAAH